MIVIREYDPTWPGQFEIVRTSLQASLGELALRIDHIGSTSVPGLGAKDVIDVQVTVAALSDDVAQRLSGAGFVRREGITRDHVPRGADDNPEHWVKLLFTEPPGQRRANIHVRIAGRPNQRYALLFRDYLRAHPNTAHSLELIKRELAARHGGDVEAYYAIKDPVCDLIWEAAREGVGHAPA
jgi:GrpB-like predicted nucleotidyltransferase (UPF0157 family)